MIRPVESYLRAFDNNTLDVWYAGNDLRNKRISREEYKKIVEETRIRNRRGVDASFSH